MLEFLNNLHVLGLEPSRNRVVVPARQATYAAGIDSWESIPWPLKTTSCFLNHILGNLGTGEKLFILKTEADILSIYFS